MTSTVKDQLNEAVKDAMRAKDKDRLNVLRMATAAIKQIEVDERVTLDDARVTSIIEKLIKQRKESIEQFTAGGRTDLADKEKAEISVLQEFMPQALSADELEQAIQATLAETGAQSAKDMGKVMAAIKPKIQGRADMTAVSQRIKTLLA